jgi:hypothetical protein
MQDGGERNFKMAVKREKKTADILNTLVVLNRGRFVLEAGDQLAQLTEAIVAANAKGKLTITLDVTPSGWKSDGRCNQVDVKPTVTLTKPKTVQGKSIFFVTDDSKLVREDPSQEEMFHDEQQEQPNGR